MRSSAVLSVDDDASMLETLVDILDIRGYRVTPASSGEAALERVREAHRLAMRARRAAVAGLAKPPDIPAALTPTDATIQQAGTEPAGDAAG